MPIAAEQRLPSHPSLGRVDVQWAAYCETTLVEDVRVEHRRGDVPVSEQFLHRANVVTGLQQVRYANRPRGMRRQAEPAAADTPPMIIPAPRLAPTEATRRWAVLLQQIFEVDPLACPTCRGAMRIVAFITQTSVIDQILTHLRTRAAHAAHADARSPPSKRARASRGASRAPRPPAAAPTVP